MFGRLFYVVALTTVFSSCASDPYEGDPGPDGPGPEAPGADASESDEPPQEEHPGPVTVCAELPPVPGGTCTVSGTGAALHIRGTVLAPDGVLVGGQIVVDAEGTIQCVGCDCQAEATAAGARPVECGTNVVS